MPRVWNRTYNFVDKYLEKGECANSFDININKEKKVGQWYNEKDNSTFKKDTVKPKSQHQFSIKIHSLNNISFKENCFLPQAVSQFTLCSPIMCQTLKTIQYSDDIDEYDMIHRFESISEIYDYPKFKIWKETFPFSIKTHKMKIEPVFYEQSHLNEDFPLEFMNINGIQGDIRHVMQYLENQVAKIPEIDDCLATKTQRFNPPKMELVMESYSGSKNLYFDNFLTGGLDQIPLPIDLSMTLKTLPEMSLDSIIKLIPNLANEKCLSFHKCYEHASFSTTSNLLPKEKSIFSKIDRLSNHVDMEMIPIPNGSKTTNALQITLKHLVCDEMNVWKAMEKCQWTSLLDEISQIRIFRERFRQMSNKMFTNPSSSSQKTSSNGIMQSANSNANIRSDSLSFQKQISSGPVKEHRSENNNQAIKSKEILKTYTQTPTEHISQKMSSSNKNTSNWPTIDLRTPKKSQNINMLYRHERNKSILQTQNCQIESSSTLDSNIIGPNVYKTPQNLPNTRQKYSRRNCSTLPESEWGEEYNSYTGLSSLLSESTKTPNQSQNNKTPMAVKPFTVNVESSFSVEVNRSQQCKMTDFGKCFQEKRTQSILTQYTPQIQSQNNSTRIIESESTPSYKNNPISGEKHELYRKIQPDFYDNSQSSGRKVSKRSNFEQLSTPNLMSSSSVQITSRNNQNCKVTETGDYSQQIRQNAEREVSSTVTNQTSYTGRDPERNTTTILSQQTPMWNSKVQPLQLQPSQSARAFTFTTPKSSQLNKLVHQTESITQCKESSLIYRRFICSDYFYRLPFARFLEKSLPVKLIERKQSYGVMMCDLHVNAHTGVLLQTVNFLSDSKALSAFQRRIELLCYQIDFCYIILFSSSVQWPSETDSLCRAALAWFKEWTNTAINDSQIKIIEKSGYESVAQCLTTILLKSPYKEFDITATPSEAESTLSQLSFVNPYTASLLLHLSPDLIQHLMANRWPRKLDWRLLNIPDKVKQALTYFVQDLVSNPSNTNASRWENTNSLYVGQSQQTINTSCSRVKEPVQSNSGQPDQPINSSCSIVNMLSDQISYNANSYCESPPSKRAKCTGFSVNEKQNINASYESKRRVQKMSFVELSNQRIG